MHHWLPMSYDPAWLREASGYIASGLVLSTFSVTSMRRLRLLGIGSNVSFICFAVMTGVLPILILHSLLLPINISRLIQIERSRPFPAVRPSTGSLDDAGRRRKGKGAFGPPNIPRREAAFAGTVGVGAH
jgi:hypothetical protein